MKNFIYKLSVLILTLVIYNSTFNIENCSANWVKMYRRMGGTKNVRSLAVLGNNIFAGTYGSGIYISSNNGARWTAVNNGLTNRYVNAIAVSGTNLFAGTSSFVDNGGVFLSTNNGTSWTAVGLTDQSINAFAVSGTKIFAGTMSGLYLSTNNGTNWRTATRLTDQSVQTLAVSGTSIFVGTQGGDNHFIFLSTNNGENWTDVSNGLADQFILTVYSLAFSGTKIFAGGYGVFLSTNNGANWTDVSNGLTNPSVYALADSGTKIFAGTDCGLFLSKNNGTNWLNKNQGFNNPIPKMNTILIANNYIFVGTEGHSVWRRSYAEILRTHR